MALMSRKGGRPMQFIADQRTEDAVNRVEVRTGVFGSNCVCEPHYIGAEQNPAIGDDCCNHAPTHNHHLPNQQPFFEMRAENGAVVRVDPKDLAAALAQSGVIPQQQPLAPVHTAPAPAAPESYVVSSPTTREITWRWRFSLDDSVANESLLKCSLGKYADLLGNGDDAAKGIVVTRVSVVDVRSDCVCDLACNADWIKSKIAFDSNGTVANMFVHSGAVTYTNPADATLFKLDPCAFERIRCIIDLKDLNINTVCAVRQLKGGAVLVEANTPLYYACVKQQLFTEAELEQMRDHAGDAGLVLSPEDYIRVRSMVENDFALLANVNDNLDLGMTLQIASPARPDSSSQKPSQVVDSLLRGVFHSETRELFLKKLNTVSVTLRLEYAVVCKRQ